MVQEEQRKARSAKEEGVGVGNCVCVLLACSTLRLVCRIDDLLKFFYCIDCDVGCSYLYVIINFSVCLLPAQYIAA